MALKDLFGQSKAVASNVSLENSYKSIESLENLDAQVKRKFSFVPDVDYTSASNFSFFGSAEEYYKNSLETIVNSYPYDGSKKEVADFINSSNYVDLYIFNNRYPRQNGYITLSSNGWGSLVGSQTFGLGKPSTLEYIYLQGGPHTASGGMVGKPLSSTFDLSNKYDDDVYNNQGTLTLGRNGSRESNLKTNFDNGITIEFWLKKNGFDGTKTETEIIFDLWNGEQSSSLSCGRYAIAVSDNSGDPDQCLSFIAQSGSSVTVTTVSGFPYSKITDGNWHHYAITAQNTGSNLVNKFYLDGSKVQEVSISSLGEITGSLNATIGALQTGLPLSAFHGIDALGYGKLSGSIDEFRFWKTARTHEEILSNYKTQVGGGTNTDVSNTELGVYYKFNEGIVGSSSYDSVILDYSGRITNGTWIGYPGSSARSTGSALVESGVADSEFKDPVVYSIHPEYISLFNELIESGSLHDTNNSSYLYNTIPSWITEEDQSNSGNLLKLTQIMANTFDKIYLQTQHLNKIKDVSPNLKDVEISGSKPFMFNQRLLDSYGFESSELFASRTILEFLENRNQEYDLKIDLDIVKNEIYKNIYNNLNYILKSKGTEKSIRNLLRSVGINEEFVKFNAYSNNNVLLLEDKFVDDTTNKKFVTFNDPSLFSATIFQSASSNPNTLARSYVSGAIDKYQSFSSEINVLFPKKPSYAGVPLFDTSFVTSSVFGVHLVENTASFDWPTSGNDYNFQLYAVRPEIESDQAYFLLTNRAGSFSVTSSLYKDVYTNSEWNFVVRVYNDKYPYFTSGSLSGQKYYIDLLGYNTEGSFVRNEFKITKELTSSEAEPLITSKKRYYIGANRTNFTGSVVNNSDIKVSTLRHYDTFVSDTSARIHSIDRSNFGLEQPYKNKFTLTSGSQGLENIYIPEIVFNNLNIDFELVTGSDSNGRFTVIDFSSGSLSQGQQRYSTLGPNLSTQYEFVGYGFPANSTSIIGTELLVGARLMLPEQVNSSDSVNILERDDEFFTRDNYVFSMNYALEKSYYATISQEILDFYGSIVSFNNIIGEVVDKYRDEYSKLRFLRDNFFEKIDSLSGFERFYSFYKWIDDSIADFITQLVPASAKVDSNIKDIIESHILERNKVRQEFPNIKFNSKVSNTSNEITGVIKGRRELGANWRTNHQPTTGTSVSTDQSTGVDWWGRLESLSDSQASSGNSTIDNQREKFRFVKNNRYHKKSTRLIDSNNNEYFRSLDNLPSTESTFQPAVELGKGRTILGIGINSKYAKNLGAMRAKISRFAKGDIFALRAVSDSQAFPKDDLEVQRNIKKNHSINEFRNSNVGLTSDDYILDNAELAFPGTFISNSVGSLDSSEIANLHLDSGHDSLEGSLQGPFTQEHVGGLQYRHQGFNRDLATARNRAEGFKIAPISNQGFSIRSPQSVSGSNNAVTAAPYAPYLRDERAKRPVNIKNIKHTTSSLNLGNYFKDYEVVTLNSREKYNKAFVQNGGFATSSITSSYINNFYDFAKPDRKIVSGTVYDGKTSAYTTHVFVNRFSAPGGPETAGDSAGGAGLDYNSAEFSPYNSLNYRNTTVRNPLRTLLTLHSERFGLASGSVVSVNDYSLSGSTAVTASYHKNHRNGRNKISQTTSGDFVANSTPEISKVYDNAFITYAIPATEFQYNWITSSVNKSSSKILNYQPKSGLVSSSNGFVDAMTFSSQSSIVSFVTGGQRVYAFDQSLASSANYSGMIPVDYVGLNTIITEPILSNAKKNVLRVGRNATLAYESVVNKSIIQSTGSATINAIATELNSTLLNRNGPYGFVPFKQIRNGETKLGRYLSRNNILSITYSDNSLLKLVGKDGTVKFVKQKNNANLFIEESPVVSGFYPLDFLLTSEENGKITNFIVNGTIHDKKIYYANSTANEILVNSSKSTSITPAKNVFDLFRGSDTIGCLEVNYSQRVFPRQSNANKYYSRGRVNYDNNFWRDNATDRQAKGLILGLTSGTRPKFSYPQSAWSLDQPSNYFDLNFTGTLQPSCDPKLKLSYNNPGILQNFTTFNKIKSGSSYSTLTYENPTSLNVQPTLARPHFLKRIKSVVSPFGLDLEISGGVKLRTLDLNATGSVYFMGSGYAKWEAGAQAGKYTSNLITSSGPSVVEYEFVTSERKPFYDTYRDFIENEAKAMAKNMSIIPEFRVSEITKTILEDSADPQDIPNFLKITGDSQTKLYNLPSDSTDSDFFKIYSNSDFMKYFDVVRENSDGFLVNDRLTLTCKALKKFIPYDGFYPAQRVVEITKQFFESYKKLIDVSSSSPSIVSQLNKFRPIAQTMFAPGILLNTIKSGIAVDYPIYTSSYVVADRYDYSGSSGYDKMLGSNFGTRIPFEAIYQPGKYLTGYSIYDNEPQEHTRIGSTPATTITNKLNANVSNNLYTYMVNNFLAETVNFFLEDSQPTVIVSEKEKNFKSVEPGQAYGMRLKLYRSLDKPQPASGSWGNYPVPQLVKNNLETPATYIYLNSFLAEGGIVPFPTEPIAALVDTLAIAGGTEMADLIRDSKVDSVPYLVSPDPNYLLTTLNMTLSGTSVYTITGSGTAYGNNYTGSPFSTTGFKIDTDSQSGFLPNINQVNLVKDNLENTMKALVGAINSGSSNTEFVASYLGDFEIPNTGVSSNSPTTPFTYTFSEGKNLSVRAPNSARYGVIKISTLSYINAKIYLSNSLGPAYSNDIVDQFFFSSNYSPEQLASLKLTDDITINAVSSSFPSPTDIESTIPRETFTMYSRPSAFGPPVAGISGSGTAQEFSSSYDSANGFGSGFTPPYYNGEAWMDIIYYPQGTLTSDTGGYSNKNSFVPTLESTDGNGLLSFPTWGSLRDGTYFLNVVYDSSAGSNSGSDLPMRDGNVNRNSMQFSASISPFEVYTDAEGDKRWAIKTRFETPMLNFAHLAGYNNITQPTGEVSASVARGIWHQFGRIPREDEGVFMQVTSIPDNWLTNFYSSAVLNLYNLNNLKLKPLNDICGFTSQPAKIGKISKTRKVREAVVAVPFIEVSGERKFFKLDKKKTNAFIDTVEFAEKNSGLEIGTTTKKEDLDKLLNTSRLSIAGDVRDIFEEVRFSSVADMILRMRTYNLPPQFDFIQFRDLEPMSMYIFEFEHDFNQDDLSHMWQNLLPDAGLKAEFVESTITHQLLSDELIGSWVCEGNTSNSYSDYPSKMQWMVFKVKQRAKKDYSKILKNVSTMTPLEEKFGFNWPYDYFSIIELASLDSEVGFAAERTEPLKFKKNTTNYIREPSVLGKIVAEPTSQESIDFSKKVINKTQSMIGSTPTKASSLISQSSQEEFPKVNLTRTIK